MSNDIVPSLRHLCVGDYWSTPAAGTVVIPLTPELAVTEIRTDLATGSTVEVVDFRARALTAAR